MTQFTEFTVEQALEVADRNANAYKKVPSVSRTLAAEVRRLQADLDEPIPYTITPKGLAMLGEDAE